MVVGSLKNILYLCTRLTPKANNMKHFLILATALTLLACESKTPSNSKETAASQSASTTINLALTTARELTYHFYSSTDFVAESGIDSKELDSNLPTKHTINVTGQFVVIDEGTDDEARYRVDGCSLAKGNVFKDDGQQETYTITSHGLNDDGTADEWQTTITITTVTANRGVQHIVKILRTDTYGEPYQLDVFTD